MLSETEQWKIAELRAKAEVERHKRREALARWREARRGVAEDQYERLSRLHKAGRFAGEQS